VPRTVVRPLRDFLRWEASGGVVLLLATIAALIWANVDAASYADVWDSPVSFEIGPIAVDSDLLHLVNDGLMTLFFLVIGLEVKRELVIGELRTRRAATLPVAAALGGMVVPALVYLSVTAGSGGAEGWGIPMATDTAFALGVLALLGRRAPPVLKAVLLAVAVIDDLGAMTVMAVFYSDTPKAGWLGLAVACLVAVAVLNRLHVRHLLPYLLLGVVAWAATALAGVHPTVVGVALGLLTPARPFQPQAAVVEEAGAVADRVEPQPDRPDANAREWRRLTMLSREAISPVARVEHALHPWTSMVVVPLFALANAGIALGADSIEAAAGSAITLGVVLGLVVGKGVGLFGGAFLSVRLGLADRPRGVSWLDVAGLGGIAGIGFTISLFITALAFEDPAELSAAKVGILAGSVVAAVLGATLIALSHRRREARRRARASQGPHEPRLAVRGP
jgi:NhaA family Na+:H+ antiporter